MQNGHCQSVLNPAQNMVSYQLMQQAYALRQLDYYQQTLHVPQHHYVTNAAYHYTNTANHTRDNLNISPKGSVTKNTNFSIDSILNRDTVANQDYAETESIKSGDKETRPIQLTDNAILNYNHMVLMQRRHERLTEMSHPYLNTSHTDTPTRNNEKCGRKARSSSEWRCGRSKRIRTIFTPEQLERLELEFERQQYMVGTERYYLAAELSLTEAQVKVWYQNRRIKWRKQNLEKQHAKLASSELYNHVVDSGCSDADDVTPDTSRSSISPNNDSYNLADDER